jgi:hypothetical protein
MTAYWFQLDYIFSVRIFQKKQEIEKMELQRGIKTMLLENGEMLHFWYANNAGNGDCNVTIIRSSEPRVELSAKQTGIIASTKTSAWKGYVNFSKKVQFYLGI